MPKNASSSNKGVARVWQGSTLPGKADEYALYLFEHGVKKLEQLGAAKVQMFREDTKMQSDFMVISYWNTVSEMTAWAGNDPTVIRHLERDKDLLLELPDRVQIFEILHET